MLAQPAPLLTHRHVSAGTEFSGLPHQHVSTPWAGGVNRVLAHTATTPSALPCSEPALPVPSSHHCHSTWHRHAGRTIWGKPTHFFWAADIKTHRLLYALTIKVKQGAKEAGKEGSSIKLSVSSNKSLFPSPSPWPHIPSSKHSPSHSQHKELSLRIRLQMQALCFNQAVL